MNPFIFSYSSAACPGILLGKCTVFLSTVYSAPIQQIGTEIH